MDIPIHINFNIHLPFGLIPWILGIVVLVNLALAWRTWVSDRKNPANIFYAAMVLMVALWSFGTIGIKYWSSPFLIGLFYRLAYSAGFLVAVFFYLFTHYFPYPLIKLSRTHLVALFGSTVFILLIINLPNVFLASYVLPENRFKAELSLVWNLVFAFVDLTIIWLSFRNLLIKYKTIGGIWRTRVKQIIIATSVAFAGGLIFSLIIPIFYNNFLDWLGPIFTLFMASYIWYHIFWVPGRVPKRYRPEH